MKNIYVIILSFSYFISFSQNNPTELITLKYVDVTIKANICVTNPIIEYNEEKEYFWYLEDIGIKSTKGASGGRLLHGKFDIFDKDGNLLLQEYYKNGLKNGKSLIFNTSGEIMEKRIYEDGLTIYWKRPEYYDSTKYYVESIGYPYFEDTLRIYYSYGKLYKEIITINDSDRIRLNLIYYKFNNQLSHKYYTHGLFSILIGEYNEYYENGNISVKGYYARNDVDDFKEGIWTWYDNEGNITSSFRYKLYEEYYENGNLKFIGSMIYDDETNEWLRHGTWNTYNEEGKGKETIVYNWGNMD